MSEEGSVKQYLIEYWYVVALIILALGAVVHQEVTVTEEPQKINTTQVSSFLEERTGYSDCTVERAYEKTRADATCTRDIGDHENMSFESGKKFTAELENGSIVILEDYNY